MAEKNLTGRFQFTYASIETWITNDPVMKQGEFGFTTVATESVNKNGVKNPPAVLMKVGDGTSKWSELSFLSGLAADVSAWAKADTKPTYSATEISGLSDYIGEQIQDTDTQYRLTKVTDYSYKLQSKSKDGSTWTDVSGSTINVPDPTADITALRELVGNTAVATQIANAISALNLENTYDAKGAAEAVQTALIGTDKDTKDSNTIKGAKAYADSKVAEVPDYTVTVDTSSTTAGALKSYTFKQLGNTIATVDIPKDLVVQEGSVGTVTQAGKPYAGAKVGDKYIELVIANQTEHIYVPANSLVDVYTAQENAAEVQVSISDSNVISASIVNGSIAKTKLASAVQTSLGKADTALQQVTTTTNGGLKVTNNNKIDIDDSVTFVFNCSLF